MKPERGVHEQPDPDHPDIAPHHTHMGDHGGIAGITGPLAHHARIGDSKRLERKADGDTAGHQYGEHGDLQRNPPGQTETQSKGTASQQTDEPRQISVAGPIVSREGMPVTHRAVNGGDQSHPNRYQQPASERDVAWQQGRPA